MEEKLRQLLEGEKKALVLIGKHLPEPEQASFFRDLDGCLVSPVTDDESRLVFQLLNYERPQYKGQHLYHCEGRVVDADNAPITVCIYADHNDRLFEMELIKWEDAPVIGPQWDTFELTC